MQLTSILLLVIQQLTVMGTPAEEGGNGKQFLIDAGAFDDVSCSLMAHPAMFNIVKKPWLANQLYAFISKNYMYWLLLLI